MRPAAIRRIVLEQSKRANVGHIGSCLCIVEILSALYGRVLRIAWPEDPERDRFLLSKGHAGLALYAALAERGWLSTSDLSTFCGDGTRLGVHPEAGVRGVDFGSGSLGQGLGMAAGAALGARLAGSRRRVYCLMSDAECNEGACWEAAGFAAHQRLENLTAIVDLNGQQAFGLTAEVLDMSNMAERWSAFGWDVCEVDGHDVDALSTALLRPGAGRPRLVLARTTFGKGVRFMEEGAAHGRRGIADRPINWHYLPLTDDEYSAALAEVERSDANAVR